MNMTEPEVPSPTPVPVRPEVDVTPAPMLDAGTDVDAGPPDEPEPEGLDASAPDAAAPDLDAGTGTVFVDAGPDEVIELGPDGSVEVIVDGQGVLCGSEVCRNASVSGISLDGCCVDEAQSICGADMSTLGPFIGLQQAGCEVLGESGTEDEACPDSPPISALLPQVNGAILPGCCQEGGQCGFTATIEGLGFGCVSPTRFGYEEGAACGVTP